MLKVWSLACAASISVLLAAVPATACTGDNCAAGLAYAAFGDTSRPATTLAVFLHGDVSSGGPADYMYSVARSFAASRPGVVAVALLRPGYFDQANRRSAGSDDGRRDTFTAGNIQTIGAAIRELRQRHNAQRVIGLGHSAGAGVLGVLAGKDPGLLSGVVLVSCPCDTARWSELRGRRVFSESPIEFVGSVSRSTRIIAITGASDTNTTPELAERYVAAAASAGVRASVRIVAGEHGFNPLSGAAVSALAGLSR
jgi:predicted esterase